MVVQRSDEKTTVGPLEPAVRDDLAAYRDAQSLPNYNAALKALLSEHDKLEVETT